jgi:hypothetical protein
MSLALPLLFLVLMFALLVFLKAKLGAGGSVGLPYVPLPHLFSAAERSFLNALELAVGPEHRVFGKVRVADVAGVKPGLGRSAWWGAHNRIAAKHFDFVVCRAADLALVCAVELNDKSHARQKAKARDELLAGICRVINLPLLQIAARKSYPLPELQAQFQAAIGAVQVSPQAVSVTPPRQVAKRITAER